MIDQRSASWLQMMGRLKRGVSLARARDQIVRLETQTLRANLSGIDLTRFDEDLKSEPVRVEMGATGFSSFRSRYASALVVLMGGVVLVVLVVCANVANLMLARATARSREMSVRMTLGASRSRLVRQLLTESAMLALLGGAFGLVVARWGAQVLLLVAGGQRGAAIPLDVSLTWRVLAFTAGIALGTVFLFGLIPAMRATRVDLASALRAHGRSLSGGRGRLGRLSGGKTLVAAQVALSTLLLVGAGMFVRSMQRMLNVDLGLDRDHILVAEVSAGKRGYAGERLRALIRDIVERTGRVPGVTAVSYSFEGIFTGGESSDHIKVAGFVPSADSQMRVFDDQVGPEFFGSVGAHMLRGRDFEARDLSLNVVAIDETMAKYYFDGSDPIGRTLTLDSTTYSIVGVVRDIEESDVRAVPVRRMYLPAVFGQQPHGFDLEVHVDGDPTRLVAAIRDAVAGADRLLTAEVTPLRGLVRESVSQDTLLTQVTTFFAVVALLLAALGLYGITAYATSQRTSEIGLRMALGAEPASVAAMIVGESLRLICIGLGVGLPAGLGAARLLRGHIFQLSHVDLPSLTIAAAVLLGVAVGASWLPARHAARIGPIEALRIE
jgi:predicted permease